MSRLLGLCLLAGGLLPTAARPWGGFTHQWLSQQTLEETADQPASRVLLEDPELRSALLGAAMAPDCDIDVLRLRGDHRLHLLMHREDFAARLVERSRGDPRSLALALGWRLHVIQDRTAAERPTRPGERRNYPDAKFTFPRGELYGRNHILAEGMLDLLSLTRPDSPREPLALDPDLLHQAAADLGEDVPRERFREMGDRYTASLTWIRNLFESVALHQAEGILPSLADFYADAWEGVDGSKGLRDALADSLEAWETWNREDPHLRRDLSRTRPPPGGSGSPELLGLAIQGLLPWALSGPTDLISELQDGGQLTRSALVSFFRDLVTTEETEYPRFLDHLVREEDRQRAARRARRTAGR